MRRFLRQHWHLILGVVLGLLLYAAAPSVSAEPEPMPAIAPSISATTTAPCMATHYMWVDLRTGMLSIDPQRSYEDIDLDCQMRMTNEQLAKVSGFHTRAEIEAHSIVAKYNADRERKLFIAHIAFNTLLVLIGIALLLGAAKAIIWVRRPRIEI